MLRLRIEFHELNSYSHIYSPYFTVGDGHPDEHLKVPGRQVLTLLQGMKDQLEKEVHWKPRKIPERSSVEGIHGRIHGSTDHHGSMDWGFNGI